MTVLFLLSISLLFISNSSSDHLINTKCQCYQSFLRQLTPKIDLCKKVSSLEMRKNCFVANYVFLKDESLVYRWHSLFSVLLFGFLTNCGPDHRGKPLTERGNTQFEPNFVLNDDFGIRRFQSPQKRNPFMFRGKQVL